MVTLPALIRCRDAEGSPKGIPSENKDTNFEIVAQRCRETKHLLLKYNGLLRRYEGEKPWVEPEDKGLLYKHVGDWYREHRKPLSSQWIPTEKREIPESVSRDIGLAIAKAYEDHGYRLNGSLSAMEVGAITKNILSKHWERRGWRKKQEYNVRLNELSYEVYEEATAYIIEKLDMCLIGAVENPIKELRELKEMSWLKHFTSQKKIN